MARKKTVVIDDTEFLIAALCFDQIDEYLAPLDLPEDADQTIQARAVTDRSIQMICNSLNNAIGEQSAEAEEAGTAKKLWDPKRFRRECDPVIYRTLNDAVLKFSGLALVEPSEGIKAAAELTSATSAAASLPQPE